MVLGFKRARLQHVYSILRGKDLETEQFSDERRVQQFEVLKKAQARVLNLQYWHDFFNCIKQAGYRSTNMISSVNNLMFSYGLYRRHQAQRPQGQPDKVSLRAPQRTSFSQFRRTSTRGATQGTEGCREGRGNIQKSHRPFGLYPNPKGQGDRLPYGRRDLSTLGHRR